MFKDQANPSEQKPGKLHPHPYIISWHISCVENTFALKDWIDVLQVEDTVPYAIHEGPDMVI